MIFHNAAPKFGSLSTFYVYPYFSKGLCRDPFLELFNFFLFVHVIYLCKLFL